MKTANELRIDRIVSTALHGASYEYLNDVVQHGIHNITNDYHGESDAEYDAYAATFNEFARDLLELMNQNIEG
jgi:hypothetical protein